jgi:anti-sigma factor RsiW
MLRCRDVAELMSDHVDGALSRRQRLSVRLHLAMCSFCRRYARQMRRTIGLLRSLKAADAEPPARAAEWWKARGTLPSPQVPPDGDA